MKIPRSKDLTKDDYNYHCKINTLSPETNGWLHSTLQTKITINSFVVPPPPFLPRLLISQILFCRFSEIVKTDSSISEIIGSVAQTVLISYQF